MNILDWFRKTDTITIPLPKPAHRPRVLAGHKARPGAGQRLRESVNTAADAPRYFGSYIEPPPDAEDTWRVQDLDDRTLSRISPARLIELLADLSPEVSRALFDFCTLFNPGYEVTALKPGGDTQHRRGQQAIDDFLMLLKSLYGSADVVLDTLIIGGFLRGAFFAEIVLDGRAPADLATPDPFSARFKRVVDPVRGQIWQLGQYVDGKFHRLDDVPTVRYVPIHRLPGRPYGRALAAPALFSALFLLGLLHDLRRVVSQQGYPRIVVKVDLEKLADMAPPDAQMGSAEFEEWVDKTIDEIERVYQQLQPEDAYITTSAVEVDSPVGTVDASSLGGIDDLIQSLERMLTRALKTTPLLFFGADTSSESQANRQWEIHAAGIKSIQHLLESMLESLLTEMLRAQGIQADVRWEFAELRAAELLRDAQTETMQIANAARKRDEGWITQDEASEEITGSPAVADAPVRQPPSEPGIVQGDGDGEEADSEVTDNEQLAINNGGHRNGRTKPV